MMYLEDTDTNLEESMLHNTDHSLIVAITVQGESKNYPGVF